jgi:hypothetical protein
MTVVFLNCVLGNRKGTNDSLYRQMRIVPLLGEKYFLCFRNQRFIKKIPKLLRPTARKKWFVIEKNF